ncbi:MAG: C4-type zinc ribbon domain-containing protein [bacterium]|nr:C4-type zinc ribbon domain-containing protein [bacterium]MCY3962582.1 C4-type zinc ribbon domain-containing protein [bacterium]
MSDDHFQRLLSVQDHDTRIDQLRHRIDTLPERAALAARQQDCKRIVNQREALQMRQLELQRNLKRNEDELAALEGRTKREHDRLYSGEVTGTRELLTLQEEVDGLRARCSDMESDALELMEALEGIESDVVTLGSSLEAADAEVVSAQQQLAEAEATVQAEIDQETAARSAETAEIPEAALASYEALRFRMGGVAVARLRNGTCEGCHLALSAMELDRIRHAPADELCHCEECGRILVRT